MKVLYIRPYEGELETAAKLLPEATLIAADAVEELSAEERAAVDVLSVFVNYEVPAAVLDLLPQLRHIATRSVGYDHIDTASATARGISVSRVPHYGTRTVAEFAFALMFAISRKAFQAYLDVQKDSTTPALDRYEGFDLAGKTLGVFGTGAIGSNVCDIALGLGMRVLAYDPYPNEQLRTRGIVYESIDTVLADSDIVTLHLPSLPETHHFISSERLALMKPSAYLINTARGEIVDTLALVEALREERIAGAALDVLEGEHDLRDEVELLHESSATLESWRTIVADHALIDMDNVIVTPHIAFNTKEAKREITEVTCANIRAFASGEPQNLITAAHS